MPLRPLPSCAALHERISPLLIYLRAKGRASFFGRIFLPSCTSINLAVEIGKRVAWHRIEIKMSHTGGRPVLFLPDRSSIPGIPSGWINVVIDGELHEANFVKAAVNVVRKKEVAPERTSTDPAPLVRSTSRSPRHRSPRRYPNVRQQVRGHAVRGLIPSRS